MLTTKWGPSVIDELHEHFSLVSTCHADDYDPYLDGYYEGRASRKDPGQAMFEGILFLAMVVGVIWLAKKLLEKIGW